MDSRAISVTCLLLLAAFLQESYATDDNGQLKQSLVIARKMCQPKCGASTAAINGIMQGNFPPDNAPLQEYCLCILQLMQVMKHNRFNPDAGIQNLQQLPEQLREPMKLAINKCRKADEGSKTGPEAAYAVVKCMYSAIPNDFIFP